MARETDFRQILQHAIKAPSGHNTQPWKFKINQDSVEVWPDFRQALPVVDPDHRELYISLGCAVTNVRLAASQFGYRDNVEFINQSDQVVIRIKLKKTRVEKNSLFEQIPLRQTNRQAYNGQQIDQPTIEKLRDIPHQKGISSYYFKNQEPNFETIRQAISQGNNSQMKDPEFKQELLAWIRFNQKEVSRLQNGLTYKVMGAPSMPRFIGKTIVKSFLNAKKQNQTDSEKIRSSSHFVVLTSEQNSVEQWIKLGITLENLLLKLSQLKIATAFHNQPCEIKELASSLQKTLPINGEYPQIILRLGYATKPAFSPRKNLEAFIK